MVKNLCKAIAIGQKDRAQLHETKGWRVLKHSVSSWKVPEDTGHKLVNMMRTSDWSLWKLVS